MDDLFDIEDKFRKVQKERCDGCKYCKVVHANGGFSFYGCHHKPYRGKWVAEIKDCPKATRERENDGKRKRRVMGMGQHKHNPTAIAAKNGELPPKPKKMSKREEERLLYAKCQEILYRPLVKAYVNMMQQEYGERKGND